jgi:hypothetical protein
VRFGPNGDRRGCPQRNHLHKISYRPINYDLFGAVAPLVVLADQQARLKALESR